MEMDDIELEIEEEALRAIAKEAIARKTGARGLRSIIEAIMLDVMYDLPSREDISKCTITADVVDKKKAPVLTTEEGKVVPNQKPESA